MIVVKSGVLERGVVVLKLASQVETIYHFFYSNRFAIQRSCQGCCKCFRDVYDGSKSVVWLDIGGGYFKLSACHIVGEQFKVIINV